MHPLHDHLGSQLAEKIKARTVVVLYDPRRELQPFIDEVRGSVRKLAMAGVEHSVGGS